MTKVLFENQRKSFLLFKEHVNKYMYNLKSQKILLEHAFTQNESNVNNFQTWSNMFEGRQVQQSAEVWEPSIFWRQVSILRQNSERFHNLHLLMDIRRPFAVAKPFLSQNLKKWIFRTSRSVRKFSRSDLFHCLQMQVSIASFWCYLVGNKSNLIDVQFW